ncbi:unnamed protein product [Closterium sp. Naga37s-1]|nr:unnamed protein product [Closterium sp. Naga37s-1]
MASPTSNVTAVSRPADAEASEAETSIFGSESLPRSKPLITVQADLKTRTVQDEEREDGGGGRRSIRKVKGEEKGGGDERVEWVIAGNAAGKSEGGKRKSNRTGACKEEEEAVAVIAGVLREKFGPQIVREVEELGSGMRSSENDERVKVKEEEEGEEGDDEEAEEEEDEDDAEGETCEEDSPPTTSPPTHPPQFIFSLSKEYLLAKLQFFVELVGEEAAGRMVRSRPQVLQLSKDNVQGKVATLADLIGQENSMRLVARSPPIVAGAVGGPVLWALLFTLVSIKPGAGEETAGGIAELAAAAGAAGGGGGDSVSVTAFLLGPLLLPDGTGGGVAATAAASATAISATSVSATAIVALPLQYLLQLFLWVVVSPGVAEGLLFRGWLLTDLQERLGRMVAAMLYAALSALFHLSLSLLFPNMALGFASGLLAGANGLWLCWRQEGCFDKKWRREELGVLCLTKWRG